MICDKCKDDVRRIVACEGCVLEGMVCSSCHSDRGCVIKKRTNVNLGQSLDKWVDNKGRKHQLTVGKAWEIENRVLSNENPNVVLNRKTGKETQY